MLKEYYSHEELMAMPIKDLMNEIGYFQPKFQEIARRQARERVEAELAQKRANKPSASLYGGLSNRRG